MRQRLCHSALAVTCLRPALRLSSLQVTNLSTNERLVFPADIWLSKSAVRARQRRAAPAE